MRENTNLNKKIDFFSNWCMLAECSFINLFQNVILADLTEYTPRYL